MMDSSLVLALLVVTPLCLADNSATVPMTKTHTWSGNFEGHFILPITHGDLIGWEAIITFNVPVTDIQVITYLADQSHLCINARNVTKDEALWKCYPWSSRNWQTESSSFFHLFLIRKKENLELFW